MSLRTYVKIGKVTNLSDARYCAGMMADAIGFCLDPHDPNYVSPELFSEITGWVAGVKVVGEFGSLSTAEIQSLLEKYQIDIIETTNESDLSNVASLGKTVFLDISSGATTPDFDPTLADKVIVNSNQSVDTSNVLLSGNIQLGQLEEIVGQYAGIALEGTPEEKPGFKDYDHLADLLEALEEE